MYFLNFFNKLSVKKNSFLFLTANLNLAEREGLFFFISPSDAVIILFEYFSNKIRFSLLSSGKYLDGFDLLLEKLLKKYFTILSSME